MLSTKHHHGHLQVIACYAPTNLIFSVSGMLTFGILCHPLYTILPHPHRQTDLENLRIIDTKKISHLLISRNRTEPSFHKSRKPKFEQHYFTHDKYVDKEFLLNLHIQLCGPERRYKNSDNHLNKQTRLHKMQLQSSFSVSELFIPRFASRG